MKKFAVAAALLTAIVATPAMAAEGGEGRVEVRGGLITGNGIEEGTLGLAAGYDFDLGSAAFVGAEVAGDKVLVDGADVQFSAGGRVGAKVGTNGKAYITGGYTFSDIDDPYVGAGYQHKLGQNLYAKAEYRHQFISNFGDFDTFVAGVGFAF
ncbi:MAG: outer membrane protein [Sphingopyxis solisilvae]|uniref:outer membrane protein n=1 Tax=Sphingopyxis solisilvae TaxID=1886788 RepID=UPI00403649CD